MKKFKKVMAIGLTCLTIVGLSIPTVANDTRSTTSNSIVIENEGSGTLNQITIDKILNEINSNTYDSKSKSIIVPEEYLEEFMDSFTETNTNAYMTKEAFTQWQEKLEKSLRACSHSWSPNAVDTGNDICTFTNDENSHCYDIESMFQQQCTRSNCGAIRFFTVWEYDEDHTWGNRECRNSYGYDRCRAIR